MDTVILQSVKCVFGYLRANSDMIFTADTFMLTGLSSEVSSGYTGSAKKVKISAFELCTKSSPNNVCSVVCFR